MVHDTPSRQKARDMKAEASALQKEARTLATIPGADLLAADREAKARELQESASKFEDLAKLEDLTVREVDFWKGKRNYPRWIASWREGDKIRTVYLGSCRKTGREEAMAKARKLKAKPRQFKTIPS
ncbi:MAG: hypothetical protein ABR985_22015 [Methanotrichaceae archaeon]|jgi:hypothetical protein